MANLNVRAALATLVLSLVAATSALAHPHILTSLRLEIIYGDDGTPSALRESWHYDPVYSAFALRQADSNGDGSVSNSELQAFAAKHRTALTEFHYYTRIEIDDKEIVVAEATDVNLSKDDLGNLTFRFTLPLNLPRARGNEFKIDVFDPQFFAYFSMPKERGAVFKDAPAGCRLTSTGPESIDLKNSRGIPAAFWAALDGSASAGQQFINSINVSCP